MGLDVTLDFDETDGDGFPNPDFAKSGATGVGREF